MNKLKMAIMLLMISGVSVMGSEEHSYKPKEGYVPDAKTAIAIAVAVWTPIYGEKHIQDERPYHAGLNGNTWTVTGNLSKYEIGGTAIIKISKVTGEILRVSHGR